MQLREYFESIQQIHEGEKVYSARLVMELFGYQKWERFHGAIRRAYFNADVEERDTNFFFIVQNDTGWRPLWEVLLSADALYLLVQYCDQRKQEVQDMRIFLLEILLPAVHEPMHMSKKPFLFNISWRYIGAWFLVLGIFLYFWISFAPSDDEYINLKRDIEIQTAYQDEKLTQMSDELQNEGLWEEKDEENIDDFLTDFITNSLGQSYSLSQYQQYTLWFNARIEDLRDIWGIDMIYGYFILWNAWLYRESCSLLSPNLCNSLSLWLDGFTRFWWKTTSGIHIQSITAVEDIDIVDDNIRHYCVTYAYKIKDDASPDMIYETFHYQSEKNGTSEQITQRFCESVSKWERELKCPYQVQNYYCK